MIEHAENGALDLLGLGELLIDFAPLAPSGDGAERYEAHTGGAPANVVAAATRFGLDVAYVAAVGEDHFGRALRRALADYGIDVSGLRSVGEAFTTLAFVSLDAEANRSFSFARQPGADTFLSLDAEHLQLLARTRCLHIGTLSMSAEPARTATRRAVEAVRARGGLVGFDPNVRLGLWPRREALVEAIDWGRRHADLMKLSEEDLAAYEQRPAEEAIAAWLEDTALQLVLLTRGPEGSRAYWRTDTGMAMAEAPGDDAIKPRDTTGAGDIFTGALYSRLLPRLGSYAGSEAERLAAWLAESDEAEIVGLLRFANEVAGLSTLAPGGMSSVPSPRAWAERYGTEP